jgi:pSer/pThr/pTyr-binding forkhead associated (FHA) protein
VIVVCEQCQAKYQYDEARFEGRPAKRLRCSRCQAIFEVVNTRAFEAGPALGRRPPPDETVSRRPADKKSRERTAPRPAASLALPADQKLSLAVIAGPDAGRMFVIEKPRVVLGREDVDLVLDDPEISRQHAAIEVAGERVTVVDLGSANGTHVGDQPVEEALLENQGEFTIGASTLMLIVTPQ